MNRAYVCFPLEETFSDYPDPCSSAVAVYMSGCYHGCAGCQNPALQDFAIKDSRFIYVTADELLDDIRQACKKYRTDKVVLMGGDPLAGSNCNVTRELLNLNDGEFDICIYTGYSAATVESMMITGFTYVKVGTFDITRTRASYKNDRRMVLSSDNQNFFDTRLRRISHHGILKFKKVS